MLASVSAAGIRTKWTFNGENPFGMLTFRTVKVVKCCSYWTNTTAYILVSILKAPSLILDVNAQ